MGSSIEHETTHVLADQGATVVMLDVNADGLVYCAGISSRKPLRLLKGHGCLTYVLNNWVFTGDSYILGVKVVTKLPKGDRFLAKESIERIMHLSKGKRICPGHGDTGFIE